jgi:hypothetical protein
MQFRGNNPNDIFQRKAQANKKPIMEGATHYAVDLEMPPELNDSENSTRDSLKPDGGSASVDDGDVEGQCGSGILRTSGERNEE